MSVSSSAPAAAPALHMGHASLKNGVRLEYAEQGDPKGEPVILLHGYSDSWFSYSGLLPTMSPKYRVYALSLRGHGESDRPTTGYGMGDLAQDVAAFMEDEGTEQATVVGHSMGSFVAQQLALARPERINRLVLIGSARGLRHMAGVEELDRSVKSLVDPVDPEFVREFQQSTVYRPIPAEFMNRVIAESLKLPSRVWQELMNGMLSTEPPVALGRAKIPTLILWGDRDAVFTRTEQDALKKLLPNARFEAYSGTGHAVHWEQPEKVARDLERFMSS